MCIVSQAWVGVTLHHHARVWRPGLQMVTEFVPRGNVWQLLHRVGVHKRRTNLSAEVRHHIVDGTALGMAYLHNRRPQPLLHRDLKSPNLLLDSQLRVKVRGSRWLVR